MSLNYTVPVWSDTDNMGCLPSEGLPKKGLVFYMSCAKSLTTAQTGQTLSITGSPQLTTFGGIPCIKLNGSSDVHTASLKDTIPIGTTDRTLSAWMYASSSGWRWALGYGSPGPVSGGYGMILGITSSWYPVFSQSPDLTYSTAMSYQWFHIVGVIKDGVKYIYINGQQKNSGTFTSTTKNNYGLYIGSSCGYEYLNGYVAGVRIYNRALSDGQILKLSTQFTPTV